MRWRDAVTAAAASRVSILFYVDSGQQVYGLWVEFESDSLPLAE